MANRRVDKKGRTLSKGVSFDANRNRYRYTYTDALGHRKSIYAISYENLKERIKKLQRDQTDGLDVYVSGKADIIFVFDRYLSSKTGLRSTTKTNYIYMYNKFVRDSFGKKKIANIKYSDVLFFYKELLKDTVMFGTGLRVGELTVLRWEDCDFENKVINISHSLSYYPQFDNDFKCSYRIGEPKTKAGIRTIPMLDRVYEALQNEKEYQLVNNTYCINKIDGFSDFIFFNRYGNVHNQSSLNSVIKRLITNYNLDEELKAKREKRLPIIIPNFTCHVIRHTFCTRLYENDVDIKTTQSIMGHTDVQTTLNIYADISKTKKKAVFTALNDNGVV